MKTISISEYISESPLKTPEMEVYEYDSNNSVIDKFNIVPGFQLERYIMDIWLSKIIDLSFNEPEYDIMLIVRDNSNIIRIYIGKYV